MLRVLPIIENHVAITWSRTTRRETAIKGLKQLNTRTPGITRQPACVFARPCDWIQPAKELYHPAKQLACLVLTSLYLREYPTRRRLSVTLLQVRKQSQSNATFVCLVCINDRTFWTIAPALCLLLDYWCHRRFPPKARSHGLMSVHGWDCFPDPSSA